MFKGISYEQAIVYRNLQAVHFLLALNIVYKYLL